MGQSKPAFFKVLNHDFASRLRLPPYFTYKFGKLLPECPILTVGCGGGEEEWRVKVEEVAEEGRCFTDGWPEFVRDLGLERHDFLVFWLESQDSKFLVEVYNEDGTAKILDHLPTRGKVSLKKEEESDMVPSPSTVDPNKNKKMTKTLSFSVQMRPSNKYRLTIPAYFLRGAGMMGGRCLVLKDPREREWPVLMHCARVSAKSTELGKGWGDFRKQNGLLNGDTCTFSYTSEDEEGNNGGSGGWVLRVAVTRASLKEEALGSSHKQTRGKASH